jgi:hypothetical protein
MSRALPVPCTHCPLRIERAGWMRLNRMLAWMLLVSPVVQVALHTDFVRGLVLDLAILCVHGALSLALFGLPRGLDRVDIATGWVPGGLDSPRARFLLSGWRIFLVIVYSPFLLLGVWGLVLVGMVLPALLMLLPFRILEHVYRACDYALRRWGMRSQAPRELAAIALLVAFSVASVANVLR